MMPEQVNAATSQALLEAVKANSAQEVVSLLGRGANVNYVSNVDVNYPGNGVTALILAATKGNIDIVKMLIEADANVNYANTNGDTALMKAAGGGYIGTVRILIEHGANVNHANNNGDTALIWAAPGSIEIVGLLIAAGADINHVQRNGLTAFDFAALPASNIDMVKLFLDYKADINHTDNRGITPLIRAARDGHIEMVRLLINQGANINHADNDGKSALWRPAHRLDTGIARLLIEHGAILSNLSNDEALGRALVEALRNPLAYPTTTGDRKRIAALLSTIPAEVRAENIALQQHAPEPSLIQRIRAYFQGLFNVDVIPAQQANFLDINQRSSYGFTPPAFGCCTRSCR